MHFDAYAYVIDSILDLVHYELGQTGSRYVHTVRATHSPRSENTLVSFDGLGRPFRVLLRPVVSFRSDEFVLIDWHSAVDNHVPWTTCVDIPTQDMEPVSY